MILLKLHLDYCNCLFYQYFARFEHLSCLFFSTVYFDRLQVALSKSQFSQLLETLAEMSGNTMAEAPTEKAAVEPLDAVRVGVMKNGTNTANKIAAAGTLEAARIRAHFAIAEFLVEFCEEQGKPFARVAFHEFDFEMVRHLRQSRINVSTPLRRVTEQVFSSL